MWPQWQGAGADNVGELLPEVPYGRARCGYAVGARVLEAILPEHAGPSEVVPVPDSEQVATGGVESRAALLESLEAALSVLEKHQPERVLTLGGECSVSVAPFAKLAEKYDDDLAVIWIDSHPDTDTPDTAYNGYHAMAVSTLIGRGDAEFVDRLPATVDSDEVVLGLGKVPGGLTRAQVQRVVADLAAVAEVVGLTIAEFIPREVLALQDMVEGMPLVSGGWPSISIGRPVSAEEAAQAAAED